MGQLSIYLPDDVERRVRLSARRARLSVSGYIATLELQRVRTGVDAKGHPDDVKALFGALRELLAPADPPPEVPALAPALPPRHRRVRRVPAGR